jgi:phosphate transport system substrate-binding protein
MLAALVLLTLSLSLGTQSAPAIKGADKELRGTITMSGAFALYPMVMKWSEEFSRMNPRVRFDVSAGGAGKGIADALAGMVDIGMVSREIHPEEIKKGAWFIPVTKDAVVAVASQDNPVLRELVKKGLKKADFIRIWLSEKPVRWNEFAGGGNEAQVHVYTRSDSCGAAETWALFLGKKQEDLLGIGVFGDPGLNEAVRKDALGIGFNNINYAFDATSHKPMSGTVVLPIDLNENGRIDAEENFYGRRDALIRAISTGKYPSPPARDLYFVCRGRPQNQLLKAFIAWVLGTGQKHVGASGYIALSQEKIARGLLQLER